MKLELVLQKLGLIQPGKIMYIGGSDVLPAPLRPEDERRAIEARTQTSWGSRMQERRRSR